MQIQYLNHEDILDDDGEVSSLGTYNLQST